MVQNCLQMKTVANLTFCCVWCNKIKCPLAHLVHYKYYVEGVQMKWSDNMAQLGVNWWGVSFMSQKSRSCDHKISTPKFVLLFGYTRHVRCGPLTFSYLWSFTVIIILLYNTTKKCKIIYKDYFTSMCFSTLKLFQMNSEVMWHCMLWPKLSCCHFGFCLQHVSEFDRPVLDWLANLYQALLLNNECSCLCGRFWFISQPRDWLSCLTFWFSTGTVGKFPGW
jgi:hypothetical protein